jgi:hypothetical protein
MSARRSLIAPTLSVKERTPPPMSYGFDRVRTVIDNDSELFDESIGLEIKHARDEGATVVHVRFDTQVYQHVDEWSTPAHRIVYIAHIMIRDPKTRKEEE